MVILPLRAGPNSGRLVVQVISGPRWSSAATPNGAITGRGQEVDWGECEKWAERDRAMGDGGVSVG